MREVFPYVNYATAHLDFSYNFRYYSHHMSYGELVGPDPRIIHDIARPISQIELYDRQQLEQRANMLGLTLEECQQIYFGLANQLIAPTSHGRTADVLRELATQSKEAMESMWEASGNKTTKAAYTDASGAYVPEREELHRQIIRRELGRVPSRIGRPLTWFILAGATGSGKSTIRTEYQGARGGAVLTDPDEIRESLLPGAKGDPIKTHMTHNEAGEISSDLFTQALATRKPIISETTLRSIDWYNQHIPLARQAGYEVDLLYLHTQFPISFGNALTRTQRPIPLHVLLSCTQGMINVLGMAGREDIRSIGIVETAKGRGVLLKDMERHDPIRKDMQRHIRQFHHLL